MQVGAKALTREGSLLALQPRLRVGPRQGTGTGSRTLSARSGRRGSRSPQPGGVLEGTHPWQPLEPGSARRPGGLLALQLRSCSLGVNLLPSAKNCVSSQRAALCPPPRPQYFSVSPSGALGVFGGIRVVHGAFLHQTLCKY